MSKQITQEELESYLWGSAVLLRNHIDAGSYKQYIFRCCSSSALTMCMRRRPKRQSRKTGRRQTAGKKLTALSSPKTLTGTMCAKSHRT